MQVKESYRRVLPLPPLRPRPAFTSASRLGNPLGFAFAGAFGDAEACTCARWSRAWRMAWEDALSPMSSAVSPFLVTQN